ncbi:hypothetical protein B0H14DRAFT_2602762 [Mycena olivaceomarginata]|nr:hypothetical protein B0H14DRAFT_2602762 [Mycena olivaceomarginata]
MPVSSIPSESESDCSPDFIAARIAAVERALSWVRKGHEEREHQDLTDAWLWDKCRATESLTEFCILRQQKTQRAENRRRTRNYYLARRGERQQDFEWQQAERARQACVSKRKSERKIKRKKESSKGKENMKETRKKRINALDEMEV